MIVADADVLAYFWLRMDQHRSALTRRLRKRDSEWIAPSLWKSEFRNVLTMYMRAGVITFAEALWYAEKAEQDMRDAEYEVPTRDVLHVAERTGLSSYDCEYVVLAQTLGIPLLTGDSEVASAVPDTAVLLEQLG